MFCTSRKATSGTAAAAPSDVQRPATDTRIRVYMFIPRLTKQLALPGIRFPDERMTRAGGVRDSDVPKLKRVHTASPGDLHPGDICGYRLRQGRDLRRVSALPPGAM